MNYKVSARVILYMNYTQILYDILYTCTYKQGSTTEGIHIYTLVSYETLCTVNHFFYT